MTPLEAFQRYCAVQAHFAGRMDYFQYGGKAKVGPDALGRRNDRSFFARICDSQNLQDWERTLVANVVYNGKLPSIIELCEGPARELGRRLEQRFADPGAAYRGDIAT